MAERKELYPLKFNPIPSKKVWGGSDLIFKMYKKFVGVGEEDGDGGAADDGRIGEIWEIADMGVRDSVVANGWLAGNTIGEIMETYLERIVGEDVMERYGSQFPLLIKFLDIQNKLSVQIHPNEEVARQRYDSLGKDEIWYVIDASPNARIYAGFNRDLTAQELYDRCRNGKIEEDLNVIHPRKGDVLHIVPGMVHAADGGLLVAEIQQSSDLTFRLYDWGREFDPKTARKMHLEEAIDLVNYKKFDESVYTKGPLWGEEQSPAEHGSVKRLIKCPQYTVNKIDVRSPMKVATQGNFIIYICIDGEAVIQMPAEGGEDAERTQLSRGESVLIPADMQDFMILPTEGSTVLLEAMVEPLEEIDDYTGEAPEDYDDPEELPDL